MGDRRPLIGITTDIKGSRLALKRQYADSVEKAGGLPLLLPPSGDAGEYAGLIDGLLIPGGGDIEPSFYGETPLEGAGCRFVPPERMDFEIGLIREIIALRKPLLGICYGMQLINAALSGTLYQDIKMQIPGALNHRKGHKISVKDGGPIKAGAYAVNSTHHQAVRGPGKGLEVLAASGDGIIEAFYMRDYPYLLGVQWHPERLKGALSGMIFGGFVEACRAA